jgi:predicted DNA-binding protein
MQYIYGFRMSTSVTFRLETELVRRLRAASNRFWAPSQTKIVARGIELALQELEHAEANAKPAATAKRQSGLRKS